MTIGKVLGGILGVLMAVAGFYCILTPSITGLTLAWVIGAVMVFDAVGSIMSYSERKKLGFADSWTLVSSILSLVFGIALIVSGSMQLLVDLFMAYMIAAWLVINGVMRVVIGFRMRSLRKEYLPDMPSIGAWGVMVGIGILTVLIGILCFVNPMFVFATIGMLVGFGAIVAGIGLVVQAFR